MSADAHHNWKSAYFDALYRRRDDANQLEHRSVLYRDETRPQRNKCHPNAERFVEENPTYTVLRGWLRTCMWDSQTMFEAHSIVTDENGHMIEITPMPDGISPPFLRHLGTEEQFTDLMLDCSQIIWPPANAFLSIPEPEGGH